MVLGNPFTCRWPKGQHSGAAAYFDPRMVQQGMQSSETPVQPPNISIRPGIGMLVAHTTACSRHTSNDRKTMVQVQKER